MPRIERRNAVDPVRRRLVRQALADRLLDARKVDDALAHDGFRHLAEVGGLGGRQGCSLVGGTGVLRRRQAEQLLVQAVLDAEEGRGDVEDHLVVGNAAALDDGFQPLDFAVDIAAQFA